MISIRKQVVLWLIGLLVFIDSENGSAAPCEMEGWVILPQIVEVRAKGEDIVLLTTAPFSESQSPTHAYLYDAQRETFVPIWNEVLRKKIMVYPVISKGPVLIPGDEFSYSATRYRVLLSGISILNKKAEEVIDIPPLPKEYIERQYVEYGGEGEFRGEIAMGVRYGEWFVAGLRGGFPEGIGFPGGIAFFSIPQKKWYVQWDELFYHTVTSMIPLENHILVTSTVPGESGESGRSVFVISVEERSIQKLDKEGKAFTNIEPYEAMKIGEEILVNGHYGIVFLTPELKIKKQFFWLKDLADDKIISRLVDKKEWLKKKDQNLARFYAMELLKPNNKTAFFRIISNAKEPIWDGPYDLPAPNVGCGQILELPIDVIPYLDMETLLLSKDYTTLMTTLHLIQSSKNLRWLKPLEAFYASNPITWTDEPKEKAALAIQTLKKLKTGKAKE